MAKTSISLPVHEFIKERDIKNVANLIENFYKKINNFFILPNETRAKN